MIDEGLKGVGLPQVPFSERRFLLLAVDVLMIHLSVLAALVLWCLSSGSSCTAEFLLQHLPWFLGLTAAWIFIGWIFDLYNIPIAARRLVALQRVWIGVLILTVGYMVFYFFLPVNALPRLVFVYFAGSALIMMSAWRYLYATLLTLPQVKQRTLIVGAGWAGTTCAEVLLHDEQELFMPVGFIDDDPAKQSITMADLPVMGDSASLLQLVKQHNIKTIVVAITGHMRGDLFQALVNSRAMGCTVVRFPTLYASLTNQVPVEHVDMAWVLDAMEDFHGTFPFDAFFRRTLDVFCATLGLIVLGLVLPFVVLAQFFDDRGPVFYKQVRSGKAGKPFKVIKFRTMRTDAEKDGVAKWAKKDDDRITRVGKFLRKTRLDELPQVINILRGDMHIVGPRPERPEFITELEEKIPFYRTRLIVKPGLTGWAQVYYEYGNTVRDALIKLQYDLYYIRRKSIWMDLYIIVKTVTVVLRMGGL